MYYAVITILIVGFVGLLIFVRKRRERSEPGSKANKGGLIR